MHFGKYFKVAFLNRWNLLALGAAMGFAILGGVGDLAAPFVLAAELGYLGLLGSHPKFQRYVDAQDAKANRAEVTHSAEETLREILETLPKPLIARYKTLRERCLELRQIALDLKRPGQVQIGAPLESIQMAGLDRLLWIYLRLLYSRHALGRFLERTSASAIQDDIASLEQRLATMDQITDETQREKARYTIDDNLQTCRSRLSNYQKARGNFELLELEIDRLETKIQSLSEMAVNRQEPDFISGQVDQVANSMEETERTMNDLQFATGLENLDEAVPALLERPKQKQRA